MIKKLIAAFSFLFVFGSISSRLVYAQVSQAFNYQAIARDANGNLLANQPIGIKLLIRQAASTGPVVYTETHTLITNQFGLFSLAIGQGFPVTGTFNGITWSSGNFWLQLQMDPSGGSSYTDMGTTQLLSVPFAMYANAAGTSGITGATGSDGPTGAQGPTGPTGAAGSGIQYWDRNNTYTYLSNSGDNVGIGISAPVKKLDVIGSGRICEDNFQLNTNTVASTFPEIKLRGFNYKFYDAPLYGFIGYDKVGYLSSTSPLSDSSRLSVILIDTSETYITGGIATPDRYWGLRVKRYAHKDPQINLTVMQSQARGLDYGLHIIAGRTFLYVNKTNFMARFAMDTVNYYPYYQVSSDSGSTWSTIFSCDNTGIGYFENKLGIGCSSPTQALDVIGSASVSNQLSVNTQQTVINGSASGNISWSMPFNGTAYKKIVIYFENYTDTGTSFSFPIAFNHTPYIYGDTPASLCSSTTASVTIGACINSNGFVFIEGY